MQRVPTNRILIESNVFASGAMAGLARYAEFRRPRLGGVRVTQRRRNALTEHPLTVGGMTVDADAIPPACFRKNPVARRPHECRRTRNPALLGDQVHRRQLSEHAALARPIP